MRVKRGAPHVAAFLLAGFAVAACAHARTPEEEPTPQIRVVPGAATRSLWIGHKGRMASDAGDAGDAEREGDAGTPAP